MIAWLRTIEIEWLALALNLIILVYHCVRWKEPGRILYWLGASLIVVGLLKMKG